MDDEIPEYFPDFGPSGPNTFGNKTWDAEVFNSACKRRAEALKYGEVDMPFRLKYAMWLLGPDAYPPPIHIYKELQDLLKTVLGDLSGEKERLERLLDVVIAYGCGWRRKIELNAAGWEGRWQGALRSLSAMCEQPVKYALLQLAKIFNLSGFEGSGLETKDQRRGVHAKGDPDTETEKRKSTDFNDSVQGIAAQLAMQLVRPEQPLVPAAGNFINVISKEKALEILNDPDLNVDVRLGGKYVLGIKGEGAFLEIKGERCRVSAGAYLVMACCEDYAEIRVLPVKQIFRLKPGDSAQIFLPKDGIEVSTWECTCGSVRCAQRHRIESWSAEFSLRAFLAAAVKGVKPASGKVPSGLFSLHQGMLFPELNRGVLLLVGEKEHPVWVKMRLVPVAQRRCNCMPDSLLGCGEKTEPSGSCTCAGEPKYKKPTFMGDFCPLCGQKFDPSRMKTVRSKAFLILEGMGWQDCKILKAIGKTYKRRAFFRCRDCDNLIRLSENRVVEEAQCHNCFHPLFPRQQLKKLVLPGVTTFAQLKKLHRMRRRIVQKGAVCAKCGVEVREIPMCCSFCGSCKLGQNLVFLYVRKPPARIERSSMPDSSRDHEDD
jgi:hypothetical protein